MVVGGSYRNGSTLVARRIVLERPGRVDTCLSGRSWRKADFPPPVNQPATVGLTVRLGLRDGEAGTRKMHKDLANSGVVTLDGDLIDA